MRAAKGQAAAEGDMDEEELKRATAAFDAGKAEAHRQKVGLLAVLCCMIVPAC